jgi:putative transposase
LQEVNPRFSSEECSDRIDAAKAILNRDLARIGINLDAVSGVARRQSKTTPKEPVARQQQSPDLAGDPGNSNQGNSVV